MFCDLRGYTAFTETAEPEEVLDFLREYHGALWPLVSCSTIVDYYFSVLQRRRDFSDGTTDQATAG